MFIANIMLQMLLAVSYLTAHFALAVKVQSHLCSVKSSHFNRNPGLRTLGVLHEGNVQVYMLTNGKLLGLKVTSV